MTTNEQPKRGRGRPRKYAKEGDRQQAWKDRTEFEQTEARKAYKREWAMKSRAAKRQKDAQ